MASALDRAITKSRGSRDQLVDTMLSMKAAGVGFSSSNLVSPVDASGFGAFQNQNIFAKKYAAFRGHVYSAVNALALEGAGQPVSMGVLKKKGKGKLNTKKGAVDPVRKKMPLQFQNKAAATEMEVIADHPILDLLEKPNSIQHRYQFVYSFISNLCLTGWAYIIAGETEDGKTELYSLPTNWVKPDHTKGPFSQFRIVNPRDPGSEASAKPIGREHVAFAYLPDPSNPMQALAPASAQGAAIKIDENIQTSQVAFFENGVFPSVVVTIGKNPHPDVPAGVRPRLTAAQRRQVYAAVKKVSGGVANYGNPAIVDGLIEKIDRLSATQNEMGWEKSEKTVRSRILSAFGVHPFILGEEMAGSYAQAYIVQSRFGTKINVFLSLLSTIVTEFVPNLFDKKEEGLLIWWDKFEPVDPSMKQSLWTSARTNGDVTQNEFRAMMGLPPDEDQNESLIDKSMLTGVIQIAGQVKQGALDPKQAKAILEGLGLPSKLAAAIAGPGMPPEGADPMTGMGAEAEMDPAETSDEDAMAQLTEAMKQMETLLVA